MYQRNKFMEQLREEISNYKFLPLGSTWNMSVEMGVKQQGY